VEVFFARPVLRMLIQQPLVATNRNGQYDVICTVSGGGLSGQAAPLRHGLAKALTYYEPELRGALKKAGFLTRDPRVVERRNTDVPRPGARSSSPSADRRNRDSDRARRWRAFFVAGVRSNCRHCIYFVAILARSLRSDFNSNCR